MNSSLPPAVVYLTPDPISVLPSLALGCLERLVQDKEVDHVVHVVVLDRQRLAARPQALVQDGQLESGQARWPNLELDVLNLDQAHLVLLRKKL